MKGTDLEELPSVVGSGYIEHGLHIHESVGVPNTAAITPLQDCVVQRYLLHLPYHVASGQPHFHLNISFL